MSIKMGDNIFDLLNLYIYLIIYNDDHIYVYILDNNNNDAFLSILLNHIIYIVHIIICLYLYLY